MARLRRTSPAMPGWHRRRAGRGFTYTDQDGGRLDAESVERVKSLAIPPAWEQVWICPYPNGHLQATGVDAAGRVQYLYHPDWRTKRDRAKFDRVSKVALKLPDARRQVEDDLSQRGMPRSRACAAAVRLLDVGYFRIGNDIYASSNGSFGLTTLERQHVRGRKGALLFEFTGKSGVEHSVTVDDPAVLPVLKALRRRADDSPRLLAYRDGDAWHDLSSTQVNDYLRELFDGEMTAKDFRTWHATVIAAEALALTEEPGETAASRKRAVRAAVGEVSDYLGNTVAVARASYIDPRVIDQYESGVTIAEAARRSCRTPAARQAALEQAVLALLAA